MRNEGYVLFVLLLMLLFVATALLEFKEDGYFSQLMLRQLTSLVSARSILRQAFDIISSTSTASSDCVMRSNDRAELEAFWRLNPDLCQLTLMDMKVDYAVHEYHSDEFSAHYWQYTLRATTHFSGVWLQVVQDDSTKEITAWKYAA